MTEHGAVCILAFSFRFFVKKGKPTCRSASCLWEKRGNIYQRQWTNIGCSQYNTIWNVLIQKQTAGALRNTPRMGRPRRTTDDRQTVGDINNLHREKKWDSWIKWFFPPLGKNPLVHQTNSPDMKSRPVWPTYFSTTDPTWTQWRTKQLPPAHQS